MGTFTGWYHLRVHKPVVYANRHDHDRWHTPQIVSPGVDHVFYLVAGHPLNKVVQAVATARHCYYNGGRERWDGSIGRPVMLCNPVYAATADEAIITWMLQHDPEGTASTAQAMLAHLSPAGRQEWLRRSLGDMAGLLMRPAPSPAPASNSIHLVVSPKIRVMPSVTMTQGAVVTEEDEEAEDEDDEDGEDGEEDEDDEEDEEDEEDEGPDFLAPPTVPPCPQLYRQSGVTFLTMRAAETYRRFLEAGKNQYSADVPEVERVTPTSPEEVLLDLLPRKEERYFQVDLTTIPQAILVKWALSRLTPAQQKILQEAGGQPLELQVDQESLEGGPQITVVIKPRIQVGAVINRR